jgi:hypothetical protein
MEATQETKHCIKCDSDIDIAYYNDHNCYYEKKLKHLRTLIKQAETENDALKSQNLEIRVLIEEMEKEKTDTYENIMGTLGPIKEKLNISN